MSVKHSQTGTKLHMTSALPIINNALNNIRRAQSSSCRLATPLLATPLLCSPGVCVGDATPPPVFIVVFPIAIVEEVAVVKLLLAGTIIVLNDMLLVPALDVAAMPVGMDEFAAATAAPHIPIQAPMELPSP